MIIKPLMLAKTYADQDVTGWVMSEKLDGVWARYQDGKFYSKYGNRFIVPPNYCKELPKNVMLDGELWGGRESFQYVTGVTRKDKPIEEEWLTINFAIHDCPSALPFKKRYELLMNVVGNGRDFLIVAQTLIGEMGQAKQFFNIAIALGGEGAMFKDPSAPYVHGRVGTFLKWKPKYSEEAKVIAHIPGKDGFAGTTGSLYCEWNGKYFKMGGMTRATRKNPPAIGSIVTFKYCHLTDEGIPKSAQFVCVRNYE